MYHLFKGRLFLTGETERERRNYELVGNVFFLYLSRIRSSNLLQFRITSQIMNPLYIWQYCRRCIAFTGSRLHNIE